MKHCVPQGQQTVFRFAAGVPQYLQKALCIPLKAEITLKGAVQGFSISENNQVSSITKSHLLSAGNVGKKKKKGEY